MFFAIWSAILQNVQDGSGLRIQSASARWNDLTRARWTRDQQVLFPTEPLMGSGLREG
jgi:hypothetical protein